MTNLLLDQPTSEKKPTLSEERLVIQKVLARLGRPASLYRIDARKVWNGQYRVNVYCAVEEPDRPVQSVELTDSFFVKMADGEIVSQPEVHRRYE